MSIVVEMSTAPNTAHQGKYFYCYVDNIPDHIAFQAYGWKMEGIYIFMKFT